MNEQQPTKEHGNDPLHQSEHSEKSDASAHHSPHKPRRSVLRTMAGKTKHAVGKSVKTAAGCVKSSAAGLLPPLHRRQSSTASSHESSDEEADDDDHSNTDSSQHGGDASSSNDDSLHQRRETNQSCKPEKRPSLATKNIEAHIPPIIVEERKRPAFFQKFTSRTALEIELTLLTLAAIQSIILHWEEVVVDHQVPLSVFCLWTVVAFFLGQVLPPIHPGEKSAPPHPSGESKPPQSQTPISPDKIVTFDAASTIASDSSTTSEAASTRKRKPFSSLSAKKPLRWQKAAATTDRKNNLYQRLLRNKSLRRRRRRSPERMATAKTTVSAGPYAVPRELSVPVVEQKPNLATRTSSMGEYVGSTADSLADYVVEPLCPMRGMDIFLTDDCQADIGTHPWLIRQGLRAVPTICGNIMTPWGNVLMYYAMPEWVTDFNNIVEYENDPREVKAFKRFLNGDDQYRNDRLKVIPSLADGPLPMRILAPAKKERLIHGDSVTLTWDKHNRTTDSVTGQVLEAFLECQVDCLSNPSLRSTAGMFKKYLPKLVMDGAACIGPSVNASTEPEPEACLGMWRWNRIDISNCPPFPSRFENASVDPDVLKASKLVRMSTAEVREMLATEST